jgi:hypothetical protein
MTEIGSIRECFGFGFWKFFVLCGVKKMETFKHQPSDFFREPTTIKPNHRDQLSIFFGIFQVGDMLLVCPTSTTTCQ